MAQPTITVNVAGDKHEFDPERWAPTSYQNGSTTNGTATIKATATPQLPKRHPETGIDVLIVGGGMGGLMTALECWRKGHNVVKILERNEGPVYSG
jgi:NADPH-dependent 2,4-dienoyl-CoA reductase/sulfur reductase-like enzyme